MKAVKLLAARSLSVEDIQPPSAPVADQVHLRVLAAGICGSDIHNYLTGRWLGTIPRVAGHEFCGRIIALGPDVASLRVGDFVVADSRVYCGACDHCRAGRSNICRTLGFVGEVCDGGFAEELLLPARLLVPVKTNVDPRIAAMVEPLSVALHAVRRMRVPSGSPVLVVGCGSIGGLVGLVLSRLHAGPIYVADLNRPRAERVARHIGASIASLDAEFLSSIAYAFDATGSIAVIEQVVGGMAAGGGLVLVGISHGKLKLDPNLLVEKEIALTGSHAFTTTDLVEAASLVGDVGNVLLDWVDAEYALDDLPRAYDKIIAGGSNGLKSIIVPNG